MSDPDDLLGKTDALLGRYRGARPSGEADFPVLTEVVSDPAAGPAATFADAPDIAPAIGHAAVEAPPQDRLLQEVMLALAPKIEEILGDPLRERLEEHLRSTLQTLAGQVRIDLEALVRIAVSQAVERVLSEKKIP